MKTCKRFLHLSTFSDLISFMTVGADLAGIKTVQWIPRQFVLKIFI